MTHVESPRTTNILIRFVFFALSFSAGESVLVVAASLAARIFGEAGSQSVSALYFAYALGTLFCTATVKHWHDRLKPVLVLGQLGLLPIQLASLNAAVVGSGESSHWHHIALPSGAIGILICSSIISGIAAGVAWAAAGAFVTNTAIAVAENCEGRANEESVLPPNMAHGKEKNDLEGNVVLVSPTINGHDSNNNSLCSAIGGPFLRLVASAFRAVRVLYSTLIAGICRTDFHSLAGNLTAFFNVILIVTILGGHVFQAFSLSVYDGSHIRKTYIDLSIAAIVSTAAMALLVQEPFEEKKKLSRPDDEAKIVTANGKKLNPSSLTFAIRLTLETPQLSSLVGTHLASGFMEGLILCFVGGSLVSEPAYIGVLLSAKSITSAVSAPILALMGNSKKFGRVSVLALGALSYFLAAAMTTLVACMGDSLLRKLALLLLYVFAGIGFSSWQGTAGGAFVSEIAADISNSLGQTHSESNAVVTAAFSGCKVFFGTANGLSFLFFSKGSIHMIWKVGFCVIALMLGLLQLEMGRRRELWVAELQQTWRKDVVGRKGSGVTYGSVDDEMDKEDDISLVPEVYS